jgi:outer membrane immunogenic protein
MKKFLVTVALSALGATGALAADLPTRSAPAPYIAPAPIFTWSGFYIGANAGAGFNGGNRGVTANGFAVAVPFYGFGAGNNNSDDVRFTGGAQAGFNWQTGAFVYGLETDINYLDRNSNGSTLGIPAGAALPFAVVNGGSGNGGNWFGTVRGRLGMAFDRSLFYVTGGLAYSPTKSNSSTVTYFNAGGAGALPCVAGCAFTSSNNSDSNIGWTVGGGMEYAFTNTVSAKIEYLHVEMGRRNTTFTSPLTAATFTARNPSRFDVVRVGLNFKFGASSAPGAVVARY